MSDHCQKTRESIIMGLLAPEVGPKVRDLGAHYPHLAGGRGLYFCLLQGPAQTMLWVCFRAKLTFQQFTVD